MEIVHRLVVSLNHRAAFRAAGVDLDCYLGTDTLGAGDVVFTINESDPRWPHVSRLVESTDVSETHTTEFSLEELSKARFSGFQSTSISGYPEPSEDNAYLEVTFDLSGYCDLCGIGRSQKAPFRITREVKWGKRSTTQLNWIWDELFVRPATWSQVFQPLGVAFWPVLSKRGAELESVVQLKIDSTADLEIPAGAKWQDCSKCGRRKYLPLDRGLAPRPLNPQQAIFKSNEYFGDGHEAYQEMFVSNALYKKMAAVKLNCRYRACAE